MSITVIFPDSSLPEPTDGGFASQEEFLQFVASHQKDGLWNSALHARPLAERLADYRDDTLAMAFPLQFPFGHTGLPGDPALQKLKKRKGWKKLKTRCREDELRQLLQQRKPEYHTAFFNLIVQSILTKASAFKSTKIFCNMKHAQGQCMSEK